MNPNRVNQYFASTDKLMHKNIVRDSILYNSFFSPPHVSLYSSLNVQLDQLQWSILQINTKSCTAAKAHFNVLSSRLGKLSAEPWRVVKLTACARILTALSIPQRFVWIESALCITVSTSLTEVVVVDERRHIRGCGVGSAWAVPYRNVVVSKGRSKGPDMLTRRGTVRETHSIDVSTVDVICGAVEWSGGSNLITCDPTTYFAVRLAVHTE